MSRQLKPLSVFTHMTSMDIIRAATIEVDKKAIVRRDVKRRVLGKKHELERTVLTSIINNEYVPPTARLMANFELDSLPVDSNLKRHKSRSIVGGRIRGMQNERYGIDRISFKILADIDELPGTKRYIW